MTPSRSMAWWASTILSVLLGLLFIFTGSAKVLGSPMMLEQFQNWGYPLWFATLVGIIEVVGAVLLFIPASRLFGCIALAVIMIGAIGTHVVNGEWVNAVVPLGILIALVWIGKRSGLQQAHRQMPPEPELRTADNA